METNFFNLINANIITLNDKTPFAQSITISNGQISAINNPNNNAKSIDVHGATIIPGFIDSHFHIRNMGKRMDMLQLKGLTSLKEIQKLIVNEIKKRDPEELILGFGWDQNLWAEKDFPSADVLNDISPNNPIILTRIDGHASWVNKKCLDSANYTINNGVPEGGKIINGCVLIDNAMSIVSHLNQKNSPEKIKRWIQNATNIIIERGICSVHDAWQDQEIIDAIQILIKEEKFPIKCYGMIDASNEDLCEKYFSNGLYESEKYVIRSVKAFIDGALGSRGAALLEPYSDDTHNCGLILIDSKRFNKLATQCHQFGFQLNTHAIGDKGNQMVIDTYSPYTRESDIRWRLEHAQMVTSADVDRIVHNNIVPSMQPSHCTSDMKWLPERIGEHRLHRISRWKTFINQGVKVAGGSDCPIEEGNPLFEFYAAITRQDHTGYPEHGFQNQEIVSPIEALKMLTTWGAYAEFQEHNKGKIEVGYKADITILSDDITTIEPTKILDTKILATIINGDIVFNQIS